MIEIRKVQTTGGHRIDHFIQSDAELAIEAQDLMLFPALINSHVHLRGEEYKKDWVSGSKAAIAGGVTMVFDMPNNDSPCTIMERLKEKKQRIESQTAKAAIPLRYCLFLRAEPKHLFELPKIKDQIVGLKIDIGSSAGSLLISEQSALEEAFRMAGDCNLLVAIHTENEQLAQRNRCPAVAAAGSVAFAIELAKKHAVRLYIVHVSSCEELAVIRAAKKEGLPVYAEAAPHHLFLSDVSSCDALWEAIHDETIDTIGTDLSYSSAQDECSCVALYFPLLLNAYHEKKLSLEQIVSLTHTRPQEIFNLPLNDDIVLVDMNKKKKIEELPLQSKTERSPYAGWTLQGWPRYTILAGKFFDLEKCP